MIRLSAAVFILCLIISGCAREDLRATFVDAVTEAKSFEQESLNSAQKKVARCIRRGMQDQEVLDFNIILLYHTDQRDEADPGYRSEASARFLQEFFSFYFRFDSFQPGFKNKIKENEAPH